MTHIRRTVGLTIALVILLLIATHKVSAADPPYAGTELNFLMISDHGAGLENLLPEFEKQTGIRVNIIPVSMPDLYAKLGTEFAAAGSSYDAVEIMWAAAQGYARAGYLCELDALIKKYRVDINQYASVYIKRHMVQYPQTADGKYICLPHVADLQLLAYRKDLFDAPKEQAAFKKKYGYDLKVPATYDQFLDAAKFFTRDTDGNGAPDLFGTTLMGKNFPSLVGDITPYIRGFNGDWIDASHHPVINSPESLAGIQFYVDLLAKHKVTPPGAGVYSWEEEIADFQNNKIAMMVIWPGQIVALENKTTSKAAGHIGYAVLPGKTPTVGGWAVAIPKTAKNPEASFVFLNWLTATRTAVARGRQSGFSAAVQALYDDPVMKQKFNYLDAFKDSLPYAKGWPQIGEFTSIWQIGAQELSRVFSGELSVKAAADEMQKQLDQLMRDGGYY